MRLGAALTAGHKVLIEFGGKSLLERHVMHLARLEIRKLTVVTGFAADKVRARFDDLSARYKVQINEIHNPDFTEGSVLSMNVSLPVLEAMREPVLLMDGDAVQQHHDRAR